MAAVAQLVERQIVALNVAGSIPVGRPKLKQSRADKHGIFYFAEVMRIEKRTSERRSGWSGGGTAKEKLHWQLDSSLAP